MNYNYLNVLKSQVLALSVMILFVASTKAQTVTVTGTQNNAAIDQVTLQVNGSPIVQNNASGNSNPTPPNAEVTIDNIRLENGEQIFVTNTTPSVSNPNPLIGSSSVPGNSIGVVRANQTQLIPHTSPNYLPELGNVVGSTDLRSYWTIESNSIPSGERFVDMVYTNQIPRNGYLLVSERNGNSGIDFVPLDVNGNVIAGATQVQVRGFEWDTGVNHQTNIPNQTQSIVAFSAALFNTNEQIFGFRVISVNEPDGKLLFFVSSISAGPDNAGVIDGNTGEDNVINVLDNDQLNGEFLNSNDVTLSVVQPDPNGFLTLNPDGSVDVAPNTPTGEYQFIYEICDGTGACDQAVVTVDVIMTTIRDCTCSPFVENGNFNNPTLISGSNLQIGAVYRFSNVFPNIDALVEIEEFANGASLLEIDVANVGIGSAFQPQINSTNSGDQSVLFDIKFVTSGGSAADQVLLSFFGTPLDIDGNGDSAREYAELSLPDAYYVSSNTLINVSNDATFVRGEAQDDTTAPGSDISEDPRYTFSNYYENYSNLKYRIGKLDDDSDRFYSLNLTNATYVDPVSIFITTPVICGNVSDEEGNPLANVQIVVEGDDNTSVTTQTDADGNYRVATEIDDINAIVNYEIRETDLAGYISISDVDGANDNLISRTINVQSSCDNDFVDGFELIISAEGQTDVLCNGEATGSLEVSATGGVAPYQFSIDGGTTQASGVFNNLLAGTYTVTVTDALGRTDDIVVTITEPDSALSVNITRIDATTTQGCLNGEATATPSGGTAPYTFQWSASAGNQTTATATNLPGNFNGNGAGVHSVTITDANGCELVQSVIINCSDTCDAVIAIQDVTDVLCAGENTGSTTVSAISNANPAALFTFTWNTGQIDAGVTSSTLSSLTAGVYTVSVTIDGTVCLAVEQSVTITEPSSSVEVSVSSTDETGPGLNNGTATANPTGGVPPYTYLWSNGETTQTITGLTPDTYTVTVTDTNGCEADNTVIINEGSCQNLAITTSATDVSCNGFSDGTASSNTTGGVGPFTYLWSNGATTENITGLVAGSYTVTVSDQTTGCTAQSTITVNEPSILSGGIAVNNVLCFGDNTGSLNLTVSGGTFPYTFAWSNGATTEDIIDLVAGDYSVIVTDANGCTITVNATVSQPTRALDLSGVSIDVLCNGEATGSVDITVIGGTPPYTYAWSNGETTEDISNVLAGNYTVIVTDANGCTISDSYTITEPDSALSVNITRVDATTAQGCLDGEATAVPSGGTPPYTYQWSASAGNQTTATATNLPGNFNGNSAGVHSVTITDANGCELVQSVIINCSDTCDAVIAIQDVTDVLCAGENTGSTTVSASSNANPAALFTFTWNTGQVDAGVTSSTLSNLTAGVYTVSVTIDGTVCLAVEQSVTITEPASPVGVTVSSTDETGPGLNNGTATANPTGGVPPYTYLWSNGETTQTITGLTPDTYTVTVTDANGCDATNTVIVNEGSCQNLAITTSATNVSCNGFSDGTASSNTTGGVGPFTYLWSNGATTENISGLVAGTYTVTVTDGFTNCTSQSTVTVNEPSILSAGIAVNNVLCFSENTGSLNLTVSGGTFPYTFAWSNGATTEDIIDLVAGDYSVIVTDTNGCTITVNATVSQPDSAVTADVSTTNENGVTANDGTATVVPSGGTPPYTFSWSNGETTATITDLDAGDYTITVTDANGCIYEETVTVDSTNQIPDPEDDTATTQEDIGVNIDVTDNDDFGADGPSIGTIVITSVPSNGMAVVNDNGTPDDPTDDTIDYTPSPDFHGQDVFFYQIEDSNGDTAIAQVTVTVTPVEDVMDDTATTPEDTPVDIDV
ncbi:Ig-like domain-containing protein, partial [uncultured Dokdonia sp.]|uniref:beta strand repeat-containing protein n=1 Tax=uncultured Dokdonia sp. TaxID=575653 RepID=UPI00262E19D5